MNTKIIILLLVSILTIGIVNACNDNEDEDTDTENDDTNIQPIVQQPAIEYDGGGFPLFGTSSCDRVRILTHMESTPHSLRTLENIYWGEFKFYYVEDMINYCERLGMDMDNLPKTSYEWIPS